MPLRSCLGVVCILIASGTIPTTAQAGRPVVAIPLVSASQPVLVPSSLGIIVNIADPGSVSLGNHYAALRGIPASNIIGLRLPRASFITRHLMGIELAKLKASPNYARIVAFALAFDQPYRVDGNQSITAAISQGLTNMTWVGDCNITEHNPDSAKSPGAPLEAKPAMLLSAGGDLNATMELAERGKRADASDPSGEIVFLKTTDRARSQPREVSMHDAFNKFGGEVKVSILNADSQLAKRGILGFETGAAVVSGLETLEFQPGAYADHLTSFGGRLSENFGQTTISAFMRAGATGSFGTVREPCNFAEKFPDPERMLRNYLRGDSLIEAYWKSVEMTTEGLFIGEPLARPFPVLDVQIDNGSIKLGYNRHTSGFLANAKPVQNPASSIGSKAQEGYSVGLYAVESGRPRFIRDIFVPLLSKDGDVVGNFRLEDEAASHVILGVLLR